MGLLKIVTKTTQLFLYVAKVGSILEKKNNLALNFAQESR